MKQWSSVIIAIALFAVPPFISAETDSVAKSTDSEGSCCCCTAEKAHTAKATCECDGCAQKTAATCRCTPVTGPSLTALHTDDILWLPDITSEWISFDKTMCSERTDPPLLRPPISS